MVGIVRSFFFNFAVLDTAGRPTCLVNINTGAEADLIDFVNFVKRHHLELAHSLLYTWSPLATTILIYRESYTFLGVDGLREELFGKSGGLALLFI